MIYLGLELRSIVFGRYVEQSYYIFCTYYYIPQKIEHFVYNVYLSVLVLDLNEHDNCIHMKLGISYIYNQIKEQDLLNMNKSRMKLMENLERPGSNQNYYMLLLEKRV